MPFLDRPSFLALLKRLDAAAVPGNDADVLAAARDIAARMKEGGVAWDDVLVSAPADAGDAAEPEAATAPLAPADRDAARAAINALLARGDIGEETAGDLRDLLGDLDAGTFGAGDLRYVRALSARLS